MTQTLRIAMLTLGLVLIATAVAAAPGTVSVSGQYLIVDGVDASEDVILQVVGPGNYRLATKITPGERVTIDLLAAAAAQSADAAPSLRPGTYHYDLISRPGGERTRGSFSYGTAAAEGPGTEATTHLDSVTIEDDAGDGSTILDLEGNVASGVGIGTLPLTSVAITTANPVINMSDTDGGSNWKLRNNAGEFQIGNSISCGFLCTTIDPIVTIEDGAPTDSLYVDATGRLGLGTAAPAQEFDLNDGPDGNSNGAFRISTPSHAWDFAAIENNGAFRISKLGTGISEFNVSPSGNLLITGSLTTGGTTCGGGGCDLVFSEGYELDSIEEHASAMWSKGYLPAVGPTTENQPINITEKVGGILNELEKAHIYIVELNEQLAAKDEAISSLNERMAALEARPQE